MRLLGFGLALIAGLVGTILFLPPASESTPAAPPLALTPCHLESLAEQVRCGVAEVFEEMLEVDSRLAHSGILSRAGAWDGRRRRRDEDCLPV